MDVFKKFPKLQVTIFTSNPISSLQKWMFDQKMMFIKQILKYFPFFSFGIKLIKDERRAERKKKL